MRIPQGGTQKWCPTCQELRICTAVNPSVLGEESGQRWYNPEHTDINWFRRGLVCQKCGERWLSAEVPEEFVAELIELRDALRDVKQNAETYIRESKKASRSLTKLSDALEVLRALQIYQQQD